MPQHHGCNLRKGRVSISGQIYLVTTVTYKRKPLFNNLQIGRIVVDSIRVVEQIHSIESLSFIVMPDHLHWLISLGDNSTLSKIIGDVKRRSSHQINLSLNKTGTPVWQHGFHDHAIRKEEDIRDVARYIVANPLRAGLVKRVGDYPLWDAMWL